MRQYDKLVIMTCFMIVGIASTLAAPASFARTTTSEHVIAIVPTGKLSEVVTYPFGTAVRFPVRMDNQMAMVSNQTVGAYYGEIITNALYPSPWSAFVAKKAGQYCVVIGGQDGELFDAILEGSLRQAPANYVTYLAKQTGKWFAVTKELSTGEVYKSKYQYDEIRSSSIVQSTDGWHIAYAARSGEKWHIVHDGTPGKPFDAVRPVVLSPDGRHYVHAARLGDKWYGVINGRLGRPFDEVGSVSAGFDNVRFAYAVRIGTQWSLALFGPIQNITGNDGTQSNGTPQKSTRPRVAEQILDGKYDAIGTPVFSPDNTEIAFTAHVNGNNFVMVNGREAGPTFDEVGSPAFTSDGKIVYTARTGKQWRLVVGGTPGAPYEEIASVTISPDGKHIAYAAKRMGQWRMVRGVTEGKPYAQIEKPIFSQDNAHLFYAAKTGAGWTIVVDTNEGPVYPELLTPKIYIDNPSQFHYLITRPSVKPAITGEEGVEVVLVYESVK